MKKTLIFIYICISNFSIANSSVDGSLGFGKKEVIIVCSGKFKAWSGTTTLDEEKFVDEYKIKINGSKVNSEYNKKKNNSYKDYFLHKPIHRIQLINSTKPSRRDVDLFQNFLVPKIPGNMNSNLKPNNPNPKLFKLFNPRIKKIDYAKLDFKDNIITFSYKYTEKNERSNQEEVQENYTTISLNTGSYISNLSHKPLFGEFKGYDFKFRYTGFCNVENLNRALLRFNEESKGSFSYNYIFFLLIIIGITFFVYKQGPKRKKKTK